MDRRRALALVTPAFAVLVSAPAAIAQPAATTWEGWDAPGPIGVGDPAHVAASGPATAVVGSDVRDGAVALAVLDPEGSRVGRVEVNASTGGALRLAVQRPGRILLADGCRVRFSDDRGSTWAGDALPSCTPSTTAPSLAVADDQAAFASAADRTWRTLDGGATWQLANVGDRGPDVALDADRGVRIVAAGPSAKALQRRERKRTPFMPHPFATLVPILDKHFITYESATCKVYQIRAALAVGRQSPFRPHPAGNFPQLHVPLRTS